MAPRAISALLFCAALNACADAPSAPSTATPLHAPALRPLAFYAPGSGTYPALNYYNGLTLDSTVTYAIFWGPQWDSTTGNWADKQSGVQTFLQGWGGSYYASIVSEYADANGQPLTNKSQFINAFSDYSTPPSDGSDTTSSSFVGGEVCAVLHQYAVSVPSYGVVALYTSNPAPRSQDGAGWHGDILCGGTMLVHYFLVYNSDTNASGNDVAGHPINVANLVQVSAHELAETITDPHPGSGWLDNTNPHQEIGDKCEFANGDPLIPTVTLSNSTVWKLPSLFSNTANYNTSGYNSASYGGPCVISGGTMAGPTLTGSIAGGSPDATWSAVTSAPGADAAQTTYTIMRAYSSPTQQVAEAPIAQSYSGTDYRDTQYTAVAYYGTQNPGPRATWVSYRVIAVNPGVANSGESNQIIYFTVQ